MPLGSDTHDDTHPRNRLDPLSFLAGGGDMGARMRAHDWANSPLGPPAFWPQSLRTTVSTCLNCAFPILVWWGPEHVLLYNDAYAPILGDKHPGALGQPGAVCWAETWDVIGPMLAQVVQGGGPTRSRDVRLAPARQGFLEESYFGFSYSPIHDETGGVGGVLTPVIETTAHVIDERRLKMLRDLGAHAAETLDVAATLARTTDVLASNPYDLPFVALYRLLPQRHQAARAAVAGLDPESRFWPAIVAQEKAGSVFWAEVFWEACAGRRIVTERFAQAIATLPLPANPWPDPPQKMIFLPVTPAGSEQPAAVLIAGLSPRVAFDATYSAFLDLAAGQLGTALADAMALEEERRRAAALAPPDDAKTAFFACDDPPDLAVSDVMALRRERQLRAEAEEANARLNLALSAARMVAWQWDFATGDGTRAAQAEEILGFPADANIKFRDRIHPEDQPRVRAARLQPPTEDEPPDLEYRVIDAQGQEIWMADSCRPVRNAAGKTVGLTGVAYDVTARKRAEAALLAREAELRRLNETLEATVAERTAERDRIWRLSLELFLVSDFDGNIRAANPAWQTLLGHGPSDLIGTNVVDLLHPEDLPRTRSNMQILREKVLPYDENRYRHRDGSWRWIAWTAASEGGLIYAVGRDVTAEKRQAEALAKTEEALRQAQKMEAVGQLTGGIAHDFNNMLQSISSGVELMRRRIADGRPQEAERFVDAAQKGIERAAALTYRLLAFSRRQALLPKPVDLKNLIEGICALIRQTVGPGITFEMRLLETCWPVRCDPNQLENALLNLAINARDAMPDGGTLVVETAQATLDAADTAGTPGAEAGDYVAITVRDTGSGMTPDVLARAFEPFYTTKPAGQGTGLGLSQVYGFVTQSRGLVRLESEAGVGTSARIYLPRHTDPLDANGKEGSDTDKAATRPLPGATVLLVEDEADLRAHARAALEEIGCRVIEAVDGPSGLNALRDAMGEETAGVDMLVSDVGLPGGLNGRQLADAAREMLPNLPILLMTGYSSALQAQTLAQTLGPSVAYLGKPFTLESLTAKVRAMIGTAA